jgi:glucose-6-phosphate isomerase
MTERELWERFKKHLCTVDELGISLDVSRMRFDEGLFDRLAGPMANAFDAMDLLEGGGIANPDEKRMVGHYWLRAPERAPTPAIAQAITAAQAQVKSFAARIHHEARFEHLLVVGIGGSALGPQLAADALGGPSDKLRPHFFDNTDPDGFDRVIETIGLELSETLVVVISKSGGTAETRNGMVELARAFELAGLSFAKQAVAVTGEGSALDRRARKEGWLGFFPMWDWVGGRTSQTSAVGLLPMALQGLDVDGLLEGARRADVATRLRDPRKNPAALLALMWHHAGQGRGAKDMVILPYKDRLLLLSRYLQQLVMESIGKEKDLSGAVVHQGLAVYGNKGSTDQHAFVQQLRDGLASFFALFVEVRKDRAGPSMEVEDGATSGDFLSGFRLGTRGALFENGRESITLTLPDVSARSVGALIAIFERAVGYYASLVNVNAYHQPGVEAGKKAAEAVLALQRKVVQAMRGAKGEARTAEGWAAAAGAPEQAEAVWHLLEHLAANPDRGVKRAAGPGPTEARYSL